VIFHCRAGEVSTLRMSFSSFTVEKTNPVRPSLKIRMAEIETEPMSGFSEDRVIRNYESENRYLSIANGTYY
jgi:hypothetical protein